MLFLAERTLADLLAGIPELADAYQRADPAFVDKTVDWLREVEEASGRLRSPLQARAAAERLHVLETRDESPKEHGGSGGRRRLARLRAAAALRQLEGSLRKHLEEIQGEIAEAREKMAQLLAVAAAKVKLPLPDRYTREEAAMVLWSRMAGIEEVHNLYIYLAATLARGDRIILLAELIDRIWDQLPDGIAGRSGGS